MDRPNSNNFEKLLTLNEAAQELGTTIETLIEWNYLNILKPTITLSGEVGYTEEQISRFKIIQKINSTPEETNKTEIRQNQAVNTSADIGSKPPFSTKSATDIRPAVESVSLKPESTRIIRRSNNKFSLPRYVYSFLLMVIVLLVVVIAQQGKLNFLLNYLNFQKENGTRIASVSEINKANLANADPLTIKPTNENLSEGNVENTGKSALKNALNTNSKKNIATNAASSGIAQGDLVDKKTASVAGAGSVTGYAEMGSLTANEDSPDSVFDTHGNIKGETGKSDILAMNSEAVRELLKDRSLQQGSNFSAIYIFFGLAVAAFILLSRKQLFVPAKAVSGLPSSAKEKIIMEISQKTDGTVILHFQGKEYKICKPDMDSESDQFIERLMGLTASSAQEFAYDITGDSQISFNAPLSKLVTRLGFVGLKRNLFFPRTSKTSVLFRRYITERDLNSINISADQVIKEFAAIN